MMSKKSPDQLLYEATRNASQRPLLNRLEALEITCREKRERIAELEADVQLLAWMREPANGFNSMVTMAEEEYEAQLEQDDE